MYDQKAVGRLLRDVTAILELKKQDPPAPGENFNIFSVVNIETKEVDTHCRLLYELLSPDGSHGMGDRFLQAFFEIVLHQQYYKGIMVKREYRIDKQDDNYGRMDLFIQGKDFQYAIEVKIYAGDQWEQVKRYSQAASQVYYLTLDGHGPSEDSKKDSNVTCISFATEIRNWLVRCGEIAWNVPSVAEVIRQYIKLIDKLTGNFAGDKYMEQIEKIISDSQANFESALAIQKSVLLVQADMLKQVFLEIEKHMAQKEKPLTKTHADYEDESLPFYESAWKKYFPGLTYRLTDCDKFTVSLRFEVDAYDGHLFFGITFFDRGTGQRCKCPDDLHKIEAAFPDQKWKDALNEKPTNEWWLWYRYFLKDDPQNLDFKHGGGCYTELFDPEKHKQLMAEIFAQIDEHIEAIRTTGLYDRSIT